MTCETTLDAFEGHSDYWSEARQPLANLVFLAPLLCAYEIGVLWIGRNDADLLRNGADHWMRGGLSQLGLGYHLLLPGLIVGGLIAWHLIGKYPWRLSVDTLVGMLAESLLFAFLLIVVGQLQDVTFQRWLAPQETTQLFIGMQTAANIVSFLGAGIYEEFLFRLCLLPLCYYFFLAARLNTTWAAVLAILSTSLAFAIAHYVGVSADHFTAFGFTFRALAGAFFAALFWLRGFGIAVGCHAAYDVLVGVLLFA